LQRVLVIGEEQEIIATVIDGITGEKILGAYVNYQLISKWF
jgi:hypothetical protein